MLLTAVSWIANTSGDFNNPANWSDGQVPGINDDVTINNPAIQVTLNNEMQSVHNLSTSASIDFADGELSVFGGGMTLIGGATMLIAGNSALNFYGTQTLGGTGTVAFSGPATYNAIGASYNYRADMGDTGQTLTIGRGITIRGGEGDIGPGAMDHYTSILIQGNVIADTPGEMITLESDNGGATTVTGTLAATAGEIDLSYVNATGPLMVSGTGILDLDDACATSCLANITRDGGTIDIYGFSDAGPIALDSATGSLDLMGMGVLNGNTVTSADGAQLVCATGATLENVTLGPGSPIDIATNSATLNVFDSLTLMSTTINMGSGSIDPDGSDQFVPPEYLSTSPQVIGGRGTITMGSGSSINLIASVMAGPSLTSVEISPGVTISGGGGIITLADSTMTLTNEGAIAADTPGGTISVVTNDGTFTSPGTLEASNGGTLTIQGDYAANRKGTIDVGIGTGGAGTIEISGAATLAGTLNVSLADNFIPTNQTYDLVTYASSTGAFTAINTPTFGADEFAAAVDPMALVLSVTTPTVDHLVFSQQPASVTVGSAITPALVVEIEDPNNDLVATDTSMVTLALNSGMLTGTTSVAAVGGVATFSNVAIAAAGTYTLEASDGSDTPVTSDSFTIHAAAIGPVIVQSKLPAVTIAGTPMHGVVAVSLTNNSQQRENGWSTLEFYLSADHVIDTNSTGFAKRRVHIDLAPGKSIAVHIPIRLRTGALAAGTYTLLSEAIAPNGMINNGTSGATLQVVASLIRLQETVGAVMPATVRAGRTARLAVTITNTGNVDLDGPASIDVGISQDGQTETEHLEHFARNLRVKAGRSLILHLWFVIPRNSMAGKFLPFISVSSDGSTVTGIGLNDFVIMP